MNLGDLCFPSDAAVVADEAARFRASTPAERLRAIRSALNAGAVLIANSPSGCFSRPIGSSKKICLAR